MHPRLVLVLLTAALALPACADDVSTGSFTPPPVGPRTPGANRNAAGPGRPGSDGGAPPMVITDQTFTESRTTRDPFRSFASEFINRTAATIIDTREVKLSRYSLDDLHLVAVIIGTDSPYAMVVDPSRAGTVLRRGMYVGRQEIIHSNIEGSQDYAVHWRVARINPARVRRGADGTLEEVAAEVVFERPDPLNPTAQVVERALALRPSEGAGAQPETHAPPLPPALGALPPGQVPAGSTGGSVYLPPNLSNPGSAPGVAGPGTQVYNYVTPGTPAPAPAPTTVVVQPPAPAPPSRPAGPPPVQVGPGVTSAPLPISGLGTP